MLYAVGQPIPGFCNPRQDGLQFQLDASGPNLIVYLTKPTAGEIQATRRGELNIGIHDGGKHTTFVLIKCAGLFSHWADAPYAYGLVQDSLKAIPARRQTDGWLFNMFLADSHTGIIAAMRTFTVTPYFSLLLDQQVEKQKKNLNIFTEADHDREIKTAYLRYPSVDSMVKDALHVERAGQKF